MEKAYDVTIHIQVWILDMHDMQYKTPRPAFAGWGVLISIVASRSQKASG